MVPIRRRKRSNAARRRTNPIGARSQRKIGARSRWQKAKRLPKPAFQPRPATTVATTRTCATQLFPVRHSTFLRNTGSASCKRLNSLSKAAGDVARFRFLHDYSSLGHIGRNAAVRGSDCRRENCLRMLARGLRWRGSLSSYRPGINRLSHTRDSLKVQIIPGNFHDHESPFRILSDHHILRRREITCHQLRRIPENKIVNSFFRLESLIHVFVSRENYIHAISLENRQYLRPQIEIRTMRLSVRIERMVKIADLPLGLGVVQRVFQPVQLRGIHVVAVQHKKAYVTLLESVIALSTHVERFVEALHTGIIMIAQ